MEIFIIVHLFTKVMGSGLKDTVIKDQLHNVYAINDPKREVLLFFQF